MLRALLVAGGLLLLAAPAAEADIVAGRSIGGVRLDMTAAQVRQALGEPDRVVYPKDEIQGSVKRMDYGLTRVFLGRGSGKVFSVTTTSRRQRTTHGVGVGSAEQTVRMKVPGVRCETIAGFRTCHVGRLLPGRKVTDFAISRAGRVSRVTLGYVID